MAKIKRITSKMEQNSDEELQDSDQSSDNLFVDNEEFSNGDNDSESADETQSLPKSKKRTLDAESEEIRKKKMKRERDLFKQPTTEELNQMRETENLFHSNLFRLQIDEVLSAVKIKEKYKKLFNDWFLEFKKNVRSIEETEEFSLGSEECLKNLEIAVPHPIIPIDEKGKFKFLKPSNISVIGSYAIESATGPDVGIDVTIEMPEKLFQKLDYKNYRYTRKRALYLAHVASNLKNEIVASKRFIGYDLKPKLLVIPHGKLGKRVVVYLHVCAQERSFKFSRFSPEKNSVRPNWYFNTEKSSENEVESLLPTPHYNSMILHDLTISRVNSENVEIIKDYPNLRDGIVLMKIWLRQRQFSVSYDSFNGHIITMYILHLLREKKLNTFMSSYQILRNTWNCLAQSDWINDGPTMCPENESKTRAIEYKKYYDCVFLDTTGYHNLAANISAESYSWIRSESKRAVECLDNPNIDSFQALFMCKVPFYRTFDHYICFNDNNAIEEIVNEKSTLADKLDYGPNKRAQAIKLICQVLKQGLGNRVSNIYVRTEREKEWQVKDEIPKGIDTIKVGFSLNPEFAFSVIEKGPHANLDEAEAFRKFWGSKSELRRFQDGSICEAVVWKKGKTLADKRVVCKSIVLYLMKEKFDLSKDQCLYIADQADEILKLKKMKINHLAYGTGEEATLQVLQTFDSLTKELTSLTDLPLSISGVEGYSPVFRYTDVFPPLATTCRPIKGASKDEKSCLILTENNIRTVPRYVPKIQVSIQLSISGKWPDELEAVRKTKAAFHLQIAECLRKQFKLNARGYPRYVDVFKKGFLFRLEVAHQKEIAMLKREIVENRVARYRDNDESIELEKRLFHLPKLSSALHGLHSQQPSFGPACCLVKRWLSAHLINDALMPDIVVELLVASMFLTPEPYKPAQTPQVAFLRFLELFARNRWTNEPIFVNFNNEMTREEIVAVENLFRAAGDSNPPIFISTPYDHNDSIWTRTAPTRLIINRITSLANEFNKLVDAQLHDDSLQQSLSFGPLFKAQKSEYDCTIHLKFWFNSRKLQNLNMRKKKEKITFESFKENEEQKIPIIDFDPIQCYLQELRSAYDEFALFFHDTYGGCIIGVLFKPSAFEAKEFKVANVNCRKLDSKTGKLVFNTSAVIEDFFTLGRGLVKTIDVQSNRILLT